MPYLFTSESVSEGHPDKVADQISDALIDYFLAYDANSKVACETLVTTGLVVLAGEVKSEAYLDVQDIAREAMDMQLQDKLLAYKQDMGLLPAATSAPQALPARGETGATEQNGEVVNNGRRTN